MLQIHAALAVSHRVDRDELEVHLVGRVLRADDGVARLGHVVELAHEDGREATFNVVVDFGCGGVELEGVLAFGVLLDIEEQEEARNLLAHSVDTATAHNTDLLFGGECDSALEMEAVQFVSGLEDLQGKVHFLGVFIGGILGVEF